MAKKVKSKWIRNKSDEEAIKLGCWFDIDAGLYFCDFVEQFCRQSKGEWSGDRIDLSDKQVDFFLRLYSWKRKDGFRRFRQAHKEMAKKNGKSTECSAVLIYHLVADGEGGNECYVAAYDGKQASIIYNESVMMVRSSPTLSKRLDIYKSEKRIVDERTGSFATRLTSGAKQKEGPNAGLVIWDEVHTQGNRALWNTLLYAGASRRQPLRYTITTAGASRSGIWYELREHTEKINRSEVIDPLFLGEVWRADEKDDPDKLETWKKANPHLGLTITLDSFANDHAQAKKLPSEWAAFQRYRLGIVKELDNNWMPVEYWNESNKNCPPIESRRAMIGLDLAECRDIAALALVRGDAEAVEIEWKFWIPSDQVAELERRENAPFSLWVAEGWIQTVPTPTVDQNWIEKEIVEIAGREELVGVNSDPWNARQLLINLSEKHGIDCWKTFQGYRDMSPLIKDAENLILNNRLKHHDNPVAKWMLENASVRQDEWQNRRLIKQYRDGETVKGSKGKIDGMVAMVLAIGHLLNPPTNESVYKERGIRSF